MIAASHPLDWHLHFVWLLALLALAAGFLWATRHGDYAATGRQKLLFLGGAVLLAAALTWPLGDLASHWLLLALVLQRLVLTLAVPPLLVLGTPRAVIDRLTRPAAVDAVPPILIEQLKPGGVLIAPVTIKSAAESFSQHLTKIIRTESGVTQEALIPVLFVPMISGVARKTDDRQGKI